MAREQTIVGIDIGTKYTYTIIGVQKDEGELPVIVGIGRSQTRGVRRGNIISVDEATSSIRQSVSEAQNACGLTVSEALVGVGGDHIVSIPSKGMVAVSRADREIAREDVGRVIKAAQTVILPSNKEVLHTIPNEFIVDDESGLKDVIGMSGARLETNALIVAVSSYHLRSLSRCLNDCDIEVEQFVLSSLAASQAVLTNQHKDIGVLCVDIGGGTTDIAVFEDRELIYASVIPIGGDSITNDIAIGLRTTIDVAERVKREYGSAISSGIKRGDVIDLSAFNKEEKSLVLQKDISSIINARLSEILDLVNKDLRSIGKEALLPSGAVLIGGSANMPKLVDLCKETLRLPSRVGLPSGVQSSLGSIEDPAYAVALGLVLWGSEHGEANEPFSFLKIPSVMGGGASFGFEKALRWIKAFLP